MNLKQFYTVFIFLCLLHGQGKAQLPPAMQDGCGRAKAFRPLGNTQARPTVADSRETYYDVRYVKLDLQMDNLSTHITGMAHTEAVVVTGMNEYVFELIDDYTIDSLRFNGSQITVSTSGPVRLVTLPASLPAGAAFSVDVWYHGEPGFGPGFFTTGIRTETSPTWNQQITYTLSEPYAARDWWPCKQALGDKIDSSDVWITVPGALKAGSNGVLQQVSPMPGGKVRYEWKSRYPIDYYLISVAAGPYSDYSYYMHFTGSSDSMLVQNYIYNDPNALPVYQASVDSTAIMINYFSELFGRYPFWKEKYGHCLTPLGGGMEHQTMTTLNNFGPELVSHELGHQWFGDHVTCGTWSDIWLNEGFATYLAYLFEAYSKGPVAARTEMNGIHNSVMSQPGGSVYCEDTTNVGRIFSSRLSYGKGAAIIHTLRFVFHNDTQFFNMLKHYQQQYANGTSTTEQFKALAAADLGQNLDVFFDQWIYKEGYPIYKAWWNQTGSQVIVRLQQTTSMPSSVSLFHTPLKIKFYSAAGDTTVRINNNAATETFVFSWDKTADSIALDPDNDILNRTDSIRRDFSLLSINGFDTALFLVYPNPATDFWTLEGMPVRSDLALYDCSGRRLWQGNNGNDNTVKIDSRTLSRGVYLLYVYKKGSAAQAIRLVKKE